MFRGIIPGPHFPTGQGHLRHLHLMKLFFRSLICINVHFIFFFGHAVNIQQLPGVHEFLQITGEDVGRLIAT